MIRRVELRDSKTIANIYNEYVIHSVATFETKPLKEGEMRSRIIEIFKNFPYWVYEIDDILHYCVANIPGAVPQTSTLALTNATLPYVIKLADRGWEKACEEDPGLELGLNIVEGKIVYPAVAEAFPSLKA